MVENNEHRFPNKIFVKIDNLCEKSDNRPRNSSFKNKIGMSLNPKGQHNSIFLGRSASGPIGPPLFHF